MHQTDFFDRLDQSAQTIKVSVNQEQPDRWRASIAGGWWTALGSSREKAIQQVVARYHKEQNYFGRG